MAVTTRDEYNTSGLSRRKVALVEKLPDHDRGGQVLADLSVAADPQSETASSLHAIKVFLTQELTTTSHTRPPYTDPTMLQSHVAFWDTDRDGIIWPMDVYRGFRRLGFGYFISTMSFLIPLFFSYPTQLARSLAPDPLFRIHVAKDDLRACYEGTIFHRIAEEQNPKKFI